MNNSVDILNELKHITPFLAGINKVNVFTVPHGYFETVPGTVLACLKENIATGTIEVNDIPAGYFDNLSTTILAKIKEAEANELQEISPVLSAIKKVNPFEVPAQYFEQLPATIFSKIDTDELPALLKDVQSIQPFEVPNGYFDNVAADILNKVNQQNGAKIIIMSRQRSLLIKYAAAAMLTGAVALGIYKFSNNTPAVVTVNTTETAAVLEPGIEKGKNMDDKKFDETLNSLNEADIVKYLEKNGTDGDIALLTSSVDENNLPKQEDYLSDDKTLDNFLETISKEN